MAPPLATLLETLDYAQVVYCLLRDGDQISVADDRGAREVDLLVHPAHLESLETILEQTGFIALPAWGHAPHRFFVRYDAHADYWLKCDVVTAVACGSPIHNLRTALGADCLARRQRAGITYVPAPEEELITLLLHCVVDKNAVRPARAERLRVLRRRVTREPIVSAHVARYWSPAVTWPDIAAAIDRADWGWFLAQRREVIARLSRHDRVRVFTRGARDRLLRRLRRCIELARPTAPSIALLAPDGAGKSTLAAEIGRRFFAPVHHAYMGLYQGAGARTRSGLPGLGLLRNVVTQWQRYVTARRAQASGHLVIFDRYTYDAWLPASNGQTIISRIRRGALAHACPAPDLVLLLDAPGAVLYARKHEHSAARLEQQRQAYLCMRWRIPHAIVVDAASAPGDLRRTAMALIWKEYRHKALRRRYARRTRLPGESRSAPRRPASS